MNDKERFEKGMAVRREVLGDAYVDRAQANKNPWNTEFQDLITRYAWGEIWTRPGLPRHTRSLMTICMMVALNREEELSFICKQQPIMVCRAMKLKKLYYKLQSIAACQLLTLLLHWHKKYLQKWMPLAHPNLHLRQSK